MGFFDADDPPPAPDMSGIITAAKELSTIATQIGKEQLDWARNEYAQNKGDIGGFIDQISSDSDVARSYTQKFQDIADKQLQVAEQASGIKDAAMTQATKQGAVQDTQLDIQKQQLGNQDVQLQFQKELQQLQQDFRGDQQAIQQKADQLFDQYSKTYPGMMERFAADAEAYGTPEKIAQARAGAQAGVGEQFQAAREAATRQLESFGVKPSDTRFAALDLGTRIKEAATKAAAGQAAAQQQEDKAFQLRQAAIAQGKDLPANATAMTGQATAAGNLTNAAGATAVGAGNTAANFGQVANSAGANAIGAGNAGTAALNTATGATNAETGALQGGTSATAGGLSGNIAAANETAKAIDATNSTFATGSNAMGTPGSYLQTGLGGVNAQTGAVGQDYQNQLGEFKAEQSASSGIGSLLGTAAGLAGTFLGGPAGGAASTIATKLFSAEGGAIPMSASPTAGQATDDVPAQLTAGEFVMPKDVTSWYGEKFFQDLILKAQNAKAKAGAKPAIGPNPNPGAPPAVVSQPAQAGAI